MSEASATEIRWVIVVQLTALPAWLALDRERRRAVVASLEPVLRAYQDVRVRWIDTESFTADCSDVLIAETSDLRIWNHLFEALRDSVLFATPYFRLERILTGIEDGYRDYESAAV
ncbi:darcynin family protein [Nonomuraea sp. NPDC049695]|uniref:darcynin family protein n=1 Tax=Nonomuraea sp. NPDC049695 TaxID=3154734 RepID=UPI00341FD22A